MSDRNRFLDVGYSKCCDDSRVDTFVWECV